MASKQTRLEPAVWESSEYLAVIITYVMSDADCSAAVLYASPASWQVSMYCML